MKYLLCAIDLFSKYARVIPLKDKKELVLLMHLKKSQREENQIKYELIKVADFAMIPLKIF